MENSLKGLILAAGVIITCIVVGLGFFISREAKNVSDKGTNQLSAMNTQYDNVEYMMYDGLRITGSEVVNVIKSHGSSDVNITVKTSKNNTTGTIYDGTNTIPTSKGASDYINQSASFLGEITRNENGEVNGIVFIQQKK